MAAALGSRSLGTVALPGHPLAGGVSHGCSSSRGQPAAGNDTGLGTPPRPRQGRPGPAPAPGKGNPRRRRPRPGSPPWSTSGTPPAGEPARESPLPRGPGAAHPRAAHLGRCAPGSRGHAHAGCWAHRETNKVIEIEAAPQASGTGGFLLKWLQGPRRGPASVHGPAHKTSLSRPLRASPAPSPVLVACRSSHRRRPPSLW